MELVKGKDKTLKELEESKYIASCDCGEYMMGSEVPIHKHILAYEICDFCKSGLKYRDAKGSKEIPT